MGGRAALPASDKSVHLSCGTCGVQRGSCSAAVRPGLAATLPGQGPADAHSVLQAVRPLRLQGCL